MIFISLCYVPKVYTWGAMSLLPLAPCPWDFSCLQVVTGWQKHVDWEFQLYQSKLLGLSHVVLWCAMESLWPRLTWRILPHSVTTVKAHRDCQVQPRSWSVSGMVVFQQCIKSCSCALFIERERERESVCFSICCFFPKWLMLHLGLPHGSSLWFHTCINRLLRLLDWKHSSQDSTQGSDMGWWSPKLEV